MRNIQHSKLNMICFRTLFLFLVLGLLSLSAIGQRITTIAGSFGDGKPATQAHLYYPAGVSIDNQGNILIAEFQNKLVRRIDAITGNLSTVAGNGDHGSGGDGGLAVDAQLESPYVNVDGEGNLYISDQWTNCIRKVDISTGLISTIAGLSRVSGFGGDGGLAIDATLAGPTSVCFDALGNIYISDLGNNRIRKIEKATGIITTIAGTGTSGFGGDGGHATDAQLSHPTDLTIDSDGNLLITDRDNHRIRKVNLATNIISTIAGNGTAGFSGDNGLATSAQLNWPLRLVIDPDDNVYFSDANNQRVRRIDKQTGVVTTVAGNGSYGFLGDGGPAIDARLWTPHGLGIDSNGSIFIADINNNRIRKFTVGGSILTVAGNGGYGGDGGLAVEASLQNPVGLVFDSNENLLFADTYNNRIRKIDHATGLITTIAGTGVQGFGGDNGQAIDALLSWPRFLVADANDNIYFAENSRVRRIENVTGIITTIAGNGSYGFNGDNIQATTASVTQFGGIAIDGNGDIYFSDTYNNRVRKISMSSGVITTILGNGTQGFGGDNAIATDAQLFYPTGISIRSGNLYVSDQGNNRVRKVDLSTNIVTTIVGGGTQVNDNVSASGYFLGLPGALTFDAQGNLVIIANGQKVYLVDKTTNLIKTIAGSFYGFAGDNGPAPQARLRYPGAVAYDAAGNLFISDTENNRIRRVAIQASQTVTFNSLATKAVGDVFDIPTSDAFSSTGLPITFTSSDQSIATIVGNTVTLVGAGAVTITATQVGNVDYFPASAQQSMLVSKGNPIVNFTSKAFGPKGSSIVLAVAKGGSTGSVSYSVLNNTGSAAINGNVLSLTAIGTVAVTAIVAADNNYHEATTTQQITVEKPIPLISLTIPSNGVVGDNINLSINNGGSSGTIVYSIVDGTGTATISGNSLKLESYGTVLIKATVSEDVNYKNSEVAKAVTISPNNLSKPGFAQIWGVAGFGGISEMGVIFSANSDGTGYTVKHEFNADGNGASPFLQTLVEATNGKLYGTTNQGGINNSGVLFEFNPTTNNYSKKIDFSRTTIGIGPLGVLIEGTNGKLYGVTAAGGVNDNGTLFEYEPVSEQLTKKVDFSYSSTGAAPLGVLARLPGGKIYGVASYGGANEMGVLFEYDPISNQLSKKLDFGGVSTGSTPLSGLAVGSNGKVYGLTSSGGSNNAGVLYEFDPLTNSFLKKHDFNQAEAGVILEGSLVATADGKLIGTTLYGGVGAGTIFVYDIAQSSFSQKYILTNSPVDGQGPRTLVRGVNGKFYGCTSYGGGSGGGVIFEYDLVSNTYTKLTQFNRDETGNQPGGNLVLSTNGKFYGLAGFGGDGEVGTIFEFNPLTNALIKRHDFSSSQNGSRPTSGLTKGNNGKFYGVAGGGAKNQGILFEFDQKSNEFKKKYDFLSEVIFPSGGLTRTNDGRFFGTCSGGGANGVGTLYEYELATNSVLKTIDFDLTTTGGAANDGGLMLAQNGKLYGLNFGGSNYFGAITEYDPATNQLLIKFDFDQASGTNPVGVLAQIPNGKMYGVTSYGGANSLGVLFEYDPATGIYTRKIDFDGVALGSFPSSSLLFDRGKLYGLTMGGGINDAGVLFEFDPANNVLTKKADFSPSISGRKPKGNLIIGSEGKLYGVTENGGLYDRGVLFEYNPTSNSLLNKYNFTRSQGSFPTGFLTLMKLDQSISFGTLPNKTFGDAPFELTASSTSGLSVTYVSSNTNVATVYGNTITILGAGTTVITAKQLGNYDYDPAEEIEQVLNVKNNQVITFNSLSSKVFGDLPFELSATSTSGLQLSYTSSDETVATISGGFVTIVGAGTTNITAKQAGNSNYNEAADVTQILTVNKADQTITFNSLAPKTFGDAAFNLSSTATSGLPVSYSSSDEDVAMISGNIVTIVGAGSVDITANQSGNGNYNAAIDVIQTLSINKASQTITFPTISAKTFGDGLFNLTGTSSSDLAVQYSTSSDKISINGNLVTLNKSGSVTVNADQPGDGNFKAATTVSQTFCINPPKPVITTTGLNSGTTVLTSSSSSGNQWYKNGLPFLEAVSNTLSPTDDGSYTVKVTIDNCSSELSAEQILVITGDINSSTVPPVFVYPNPVKDNLLINLAAFDSNLLVEIVIYDLSGRVMDKILRQGEKTNVSVSSYSVGTYFLRASQRNQTHVAKFAKE